MMQYVLLLGAFQTATDPSTPDSRDPSPTRSWDIATEMSWNGEVGNSSPGFVQKAPLSPADFFLQQFQHLENKVLQEEVERIQFQKDRPEHTRKMKDQTIDISKLTEDCEERKQQCEDSCQENQTLEEHNQRLISEMESQKSFNDGMNTHKDLKVISDQCEKLLESDEEIRKLTGNVNELQEKCFSLDCVKKHNSELRSELDETKEQRRLLDTELSDAEKEKSKIQRNRELLQSKDVNQTYQDFKNKILSLESEIESMTRKNKELAQELLAFQTGATEVEDTSEDVTEESVAEESANAADMDSDVMEWHIADNLDTE